MVRILLSVVAAALFALISLATNDYMGQAMARGQSPSEFGVKAWADSFAERGRAAARRAEREMRRDRPMRDYLPDAPKGWARVEWQSEHLAALRPAPRHLSKGEAQIMEEVGDVPMFKVLALAENVTGSIRSNWAAADRWTYTKGNRVMILRARFLDSNHKATGRGVAAGIDLSRRPGQNRADGRIFKVHHGVAFRTADKPAKDNVIRLHAMIGGEIELTVISNARPGPVKQLISGLDIEELRSLTSGTGANNPDHNALTAEMRRQKADKRRREIEEMAKIERRLDQMASGARHRGDDEVCLTHKGKQHCAWVN